MPAKRAGRMELEERRYGQMKRISRQAAQLRRQWATIWCIPELSDTGKLQFNPRLTRTVARWVLATRCLEVGRRFFESNRKQTSILCHEYAHAAAVLRFGPGVRSHGPEWRQLVRAAGFEPAARSRGMPQGVRPAGQRLGRPLRFEHRLSVVIQ